MKNYFVSLYYQFSEPRETKIKIWSIPSGECIRVLRGNRLVLTLDSALMSLENGLVLSSIVKDKLNVRCINNMLYADSIIQRYFMIEHPLLLRICTLDRELTDQELSIIRAVFVNEAGQFDYRQLNNWINSIHVDLQRMVRNKLSTLIPRSTRTIQ